MCLHVFKGRHSNLSKVNHLQILSKQTFCLLNLFKDILTTHARFEKWVLWLNPSWQLRSLWSVRVNCHQGTVKNLGQSICYRLIHQFISKNQIPDIRESSDFNASIINFKIFL